MEDRTVGATYTVIAPSWLMGAFALACIFGSAQGLAQNAYIPNSGDNNVTVIDTATNTVVGSPIPVGSRPFGVAVTPDGSKVYVSNFGDNTVSVIATATNTVTATIPLSPCFGQMFGAAGVAVTSDGSKVYVTDVTLFNTCPNAVSVIDTATNTVTATIPVPASPYPLGIAVTPNGSKVYVTLYVTSQAGGRTSVIDTATNTVTATILNVNRSRGVAVTPDGRKVYVADLGVTVIDTATDTVVAHVATLTPHYGVAVTPDGSKVYVTNYDSTVSVIDTATDTVVGFPIPVGSGLSYPCNPEGIAVTPDGSKIYVANPCDNTMSVIDTATNAVTATVPVGNSPSAFGIFIPIPVPQPAPAAGNLCNGIYDGTFDGNLTISTGQDCIFLNGKITGNVNVAGGNFALNGSTVGGNLQIAGVGTYWLGPEATIGGNLEIANIPPGSANNSVCGTTVYGNMQMSNDGTAVQIGSTAPLFCSGNTIGGNLEAVDNSGAALMFDNSVGRNMSVVGNTGPIDVVGNTVRANLLCLNNSDLIMANGNTASRKTGQCD